VKYAVTRIKREKRARMRSDEDSIVAARVTEPITPKSLVSNRVVIETVLGKFVAHLLLYRQSALFERDSGIETTLAMMDG